MIENSYLIWAGCAVGIAWLWVCIWEWIIAKKALDALGRNPDISWTLLVYTILWIALTESAAIYWLIIALNIIWNPWLAAMQAVWAGLAVWVAGAGAGIWEWLAAWQALTAICRNPDNKWQVLTFMILFIALVESAAIYWLIIALNILWK